VGIAFVQLDMVFEPKAQKTWVREACVEYDKKQIKSGLTTTASKYDMALL